MACSLQVIRALYVSGVLFCCKSREFRFQLVKFLDQVSVLVLEFVVFFGLIAVGHGIHFPHVLTDIVFKVVQVDELDMELVVEMFDLDQYIVVGFAGGPLVEFVLLFIDAGYISYQMVEPLFCFDQKRLLLCFG